MSLSHISNLRDERSQPDFLDLDFVLVKVALRKDEVGIDGNEEEDVDDVNEVGKFSEVEFMTERLLLRCACF